MLPENAEKLERYELPYVDRSILKYYLESIEPFQIMVIFKYLTSLDLRNFNNKLHWNEIKCSSTNSPIKNSINKYNQINLSILCITSLDLRNFNNKLHWNEIKCSSTNSPIKNSINKYNQINLSILCRGYIAKGFWKWQLCSEIPNRNLCKCSRQLQQALMQTSFHFHYDDILFKKLRICEVKM